MTAAVVGVDLSYTGTAIRWATDSLVFSTPAAWYEADRREAIARQVCDIVRAVAEEAPTMVVLEAGSSHGSTALMLGKLLGVVEHELMLDGRAMAWIPPSTLKKFATGKGNATKPDMRMALFQRTGEDLANDNAVDAAWLYYAGLTKLGLRPFPLPIGQVAALDKAVWPTNWLADRGLA